MYAVIQSGGKQYRVQAGDVIEVEKLDGEVGAKLTFGEVLMAARMGEGADAATAIELGAPLLAGGSVTGEVVGQGRGDKVFITKMKRRKQYRRNQGHRQFHTQILVTGIAAGGLNVTLSDADKKAKLGKFYSRLAPKGPASSPKLLGSPKKRKAAGASKPTTAGKSAAAKAAPPAPAKKAAAPKAAAKPKVSK